MKFIISLQVFFSRLVLSAGTVIKIIFLSGSTGKINSAKKTNPLLVLGNGPSLTKQIQENDPVLNEFDLLCVNHFPTTAYYARLKPKYFVTSVPELWIDDVDALYIKQRKDLLDVFVYKTDWDLTIFIPRMALKHKEWKAALAKNPKLKVVTLNTTPIDGFDWFKNMCFNMKLGMPRPHNVLIPSLMVSLWLNYKKVFLFGVDHSWLPEITVNENNEVLIHQKHYYDEGGSKAKVMDKFGKGQRNLAEVLYKFMMAFAGYFVIRDYAETKGTVILNATKGSFIDAFDRVDSIK